MMTAIDRTIYRRMKRSYTPKELVETYTLTEEERRFVSTMTRTAQNQLNLITKLRNVGTSHALSKQPDAKSGLSSISIRQVGTCATEMIYCK